MEKKRLGRNFGAYWIQEEIGSGGMGRVFKAAHKETLQTVALKILLEEYQNSPAVRKRFENEAQIGTKLEHPNIVPVWDYGLFENRPYLVMPLMEGGNLAKALSKKVSMPYKTSLDMLTALADALDYAHHQGVIHRDLKLENILLNRDNIAAISDFGIAQNTTADDTWHGSGSQLYLAPESINDFTAVDYRLDLYAFAVIAYLLFAGYFPFPGSNTSNSAYRQAAAYFPMPSKVNTKLPEILDAVFVKALAQDPTKRFPSARDFVLHLRAAFPERPLGAVPISLGRQNPVTAVTPVSMQQALSQIEDAPIPKNLSEGDAPRVPAYGSIQKKRVSKPWMPFALGGLFLACSAIALGSQYLISSPEESYKLTNPPVTAMGTMEAEVTASPAPATATLMPTLTPIVMRPIQRQFDLNASTTIYTFGGAANQQPASAPVSNNPAPTNPPRTGSGGGGGGSSSGTTDGGTSGSSGGSSSGGSTSGGGSGGGGGNHNGNGNGNHNGNGNGRGHGNG